MYLYFNSKINQVTKKIAIIGAGTAGLASAIFLSKLNLSCDLYEEVAKPQAVGAGLLLQPLGLNVLDKLNLLPEVLSNGSAVQSLFGMNNKSKVIMDFKYTDLYSGLFGVGIHRGSLFETLYKKAIQALNKVYLGHKVISISQDTNSAQLVTDQGLSQNYDMIIVANGTWSSLSKTLNIKVKHNPYPWGALWKIFNNPDQFSQSTLSQRYIRCHTMAGMLPSGINPNSGNPCISFFWSLKNDCYNDWRNNDISRWKNNAIKLWPQIAPFIEQINSHDDLTFVRYADTIMNKWHDNKIVVMGDAAHAMSPQLGQGVNMALVDAWQLYDSLQKYSQIESALKNYTKARKKHLRFYQHASRLLTPFFQSNSKTAAIFRDLIFPPMRYIPIAKRHALTTLFGVKTSIFNNKSNVDLVNLSKKLLRPDTNKTL